MGGVQGHTMLPVAYRRQEVGGQKQPLLDLGDGLVDGLSDIVDVLGGQPAHVDATAGHQVHVLLLDHVLHLLGCETHNSTVGRMGHHLKLKQTNNLLIPFGL